MSININLKNIEELKKTMKGPTKNVVCPKCKHMITLKNLVMSDSMLSHIKYKLTCGNCNKKFETPWRKYETQRVSKIPDFSTGG